MSTKIDKAKIALLIRAPFFGSIVLRRPIKEDESAGTARVDARGGICIAPSFVEKLSPEELVFLLAHEAMHVVYGHLGRMGDRDHQLWNVACDAVINDLLDRVNLGKPIAGGVYMNGAADKTAEEIYDMLADKTNPKGGGEEGEGGNAPSQTPAVNDLRPEDAQAITPEEAKRAVVEGKLEIAQAMQGARMQGKLPGALQGVIEEYLSSTVPWHQRLEQYMVARAEQHTTWSRPNKRYLRTAYLPRRERLPSLGTVVVGLDVSGSVSDEELAEYLGHLEAIFEQCPPSEVHVLFVTTEVHHHDCYSREDLFMRSYKERWYGGTDMRVVPQWAEDNGIVPDLTVIFTDGWTPYPTAVEGDLLWVIPEGTPECTYPTIGDVLEVEERHG